MGKAVIKKKVVHHTPSERMEMRRAKRRNGPSGLRRAERRKPLREEHARKMLETADEHLKRTGIINLPVIEAIPEGYEVLGTPPLVPVYALIDELKSEEKS